MDPVALPFQAELVVCLTVALPSKAELGGVGAAITVRLKPYGQSCSIVSQRRLGRQRYNYPMPLWGVIFF